MATVEVNEVIEVDSFGDIDDNQEFKTLLNEVVNAKRLSASKMENLKEITLNLMENDMQLVSVLYRTHKSLRGSAKISSLYVFDALCRAARQKVVKGNLSGDMNAEKGNCATFLLKIDSVLDGLFQDILSSGVPEAKEKTKKIIDIWTKANTFPTSVLTRLEAQGKATENPDPNAKENKHAIPGMPLSTSDPRKHSTPPTESTPPLPAISTTPPTAEAAQAALLALLSSAASANNPSHRNQTLANKTILPDVTTSHQPPIGQLQLALLQQLSKASNGAPVSNVVAAPSHSHSPQIPPPFASRAPLFPPNLNTAVQNTKLPGPSSLSPTNLERRSFPGSESRDPSSNRLDERQGGRGYGEQYYDNRHRGGNTRGFRGGFRGRGRGDFRETGQRDDEYHSWDKGAHRYEAGAPPYRRRTSRSRSPSHRRDGRPTYSPPRRTSLASPVQHTIAPQPGASESGKDEFGRDLRPSSEGPEDREDREPNSLVVPPREEMSISDELDERSMSQSEDGRESDAAAPRSQASTSGAAGLESFDVSTFNPTDPDSWQALGKAFQVTRGYTPTQEELIQLVMTTMAMSVGVGMGMDMKAGATTDARGILLGASLVEPGRAVGEKEAVQDWHAGPYGQGSDAFVLGSNVQELRHAKEPEDASNAMDANASPTGVGTGEIGGGLGGKMQKVGDRWIFVRS